MLTVDLSIIYYPMKQ